jgi:hypothetical protein
MSETVYMAKEKFEHDELLDPEDPPIAELADCTCPEFCERDHDTD